MKQGSCTQTDEERSIARLWVVHEVRKAKDMGYGLLKVFKFREYELTCFDRDTYSEGHFADYIYKFLKLKRE